MPFIRNRSMVEDDFSSVPDDAALPTDGAVIVGWQRWQRERALLLARAGKVGVRVPSDIDPADLIGDLPALDVIAVEFPTFTDGRGYTIARVLRDRHGFAGELRAVGDVLRDQLFYMERCGFNAFELAAGRSAESALGAFEEFTVAYEPGAHDVRPLARRVLDASGGQD